MTGQRGRFVWYELMTSDAGAAELFYSDVIGWNTQDSGLTDIHYTLFKVGEDGVAGLLTLTQEAADAGARPGWIGYVGVDDVDATATEIKTRGGTVHREPADIPGVGRFAIVADPQGAVFALFMPAMEMEWKAPSPGTPGFVGWHELMAIDWQPAFDFYAGLFGWEKRDAMDMGEMGVYQLFTTDTEAEGGMMTKPPAVPAPYWLYYFNVVGIDTAMEKAKTRGAQVLNGPMEVPGGSWIVQMLDPQGALFAIGGPKG